MIYGFQEPFLYKYNLSANTTYTDNVINNHKAEISKKNILFGFNELMQQITESRQTCAISSKQLKLNDFV
jgi:ligand-binding sensor protein